jgi:cyclophilin family peptidyl-prolyl cis-trans isomerase
MNSTSRTTLIGIIILLCIICTPAAYSTTPANNSDEPLYKQAFLIGSFSNLTQHNDTTTVHARNLRIILGNPLQIFHFSSGEQLTISTQKTFQVLTRRFICGLYTIILPLNTNSIAVIDTTAGTMLIELYEDLTPLTTANFIRLANDSFYDGLVFHRVIDDFVIQGGGYYPDGSLKNSPYGPINLEIHPDARHVNGAIGMARTSDPNSATSQFYICDGSQKGLDDEYEVFGRVIHGIDIVRAIAAIETTTKYCMPDWPVDDIIITNIRIVSSL